MTSEFSTIKKILRKVQRIQASATGVHAVWVNFYNEYGESAEQFLTVTVFKADIPPRDFSFYAFMKPEKNETVFNELVDYVNE